MVMLDASGLVIALLITSLLMLRTRLLNRPAWSDKGLLLRWFSEGAGTEVLDAINAEGKQGWSTSLRRVRPCKGFCNFAVP